MRESRVRGGAASWPSLAAVAVCGGLQECNLNLAARVRVRGVWADSPAIGHGPEETRVETGRVVARAHLSC